MKNFLIAVAFLLGLASTVDAQQLEIRSYNFNNYPQYNRLDVIYGHPQIIYSQPYRPYVPYFQPYRPYVRPYFQPYRPYAYPHYNPYSGSLHLHIIP